MLRIDTGRSKIRIMSFEGWFEIEIEDADDRISDYLTNDQALTLANYLMEQVKKNDT